MKYHKSAVMGCSFCCRRAWYYNLIDAMNDNDSQDEYRFKWDIDKHGNDHNKALLQEIFDRRGYDLIIIADEDDTYIKISRKKRE